MQERPLFIVYNEDLTEPGKEQAESNPVFINYNAYCIQENILKRINDITDLEDVLVIYDNGKGYSKIILNKLNVTETKHPEFKVGDYIETCSLLPAIIMNINVEADEIESRILNEYEYKDEQFSQCSIKNCGVRKLTFQQVLNRMKLGKDKLKELYEFSNSQDHYDFMVDSAAKKL